MSKNISKMPKSVEELMDIYSAYEEEYKNGDYTLVDMLQDYAFFDNPITPTHMDYYQSKYKKGHNWMILFLILSIVLYTIHLTGFYLLLNLLGVDILKFAFNRSFMVILISLYSILVGILFGRIRHKWNWKTPSIFFALLIGIMFSLLIIVNPTTLELEPYLMFLYALFNVIGFAFGPACLLVFLFYKFHTSITDYGGIHLFLGWIYRISETNGGGHLKVLNSSFRHVLNELDSWLNETSKILLKNKNEILENFYLNLISDDKFLENISKKNRDSFNNIFKGLLVENILKSKAFSHSSEEKEKKISHLNKDDLKYLNYRLSLTQTPKIINLINTLSSKKLEVILYSYSEKLKKIKSKIISFIVFMSTTLISFVLSLFA